MSIKAVQRDIQKSEGDDEEALQAKTNTALWVINHSYANVTTSTTTIAADATTTTPPVSSASSSTGKSTSKLTAPGGGHPELNAIKVLHADDSNPSSGTVCPPQHTAPTQHTESSITTAAVAPTSVTAKTSSEDTNSSTYYSNNNCKKKLADIDETNTSSIINNDDELNCGELELASFFPVTSQQAEGVDPPGQDIFMRSKSADLKNSVDDLSSVASTQTRLRLQLKRVKIFSLRRFRSKTSMIASTESISSDDEDSNHVASPRLTTLRPPFPSELIASPDSSFNDNECSVKASLLPYTPDPRFDALVGQLAVLNSSDNNNQDMQSENAVKSASDSTLLNGLSDENLSTSSTDTDEGTDQRSPTLPRSDHLAKILAVTERKTNLTNGSSDGSEVRVKRRPKTRKGKSQTHPPCPSRPQSELCKTSATDTNDFQSFPRRQAEEDKPSVSNESLFNSEEDLARCSPMVAEFMKQPLKSKPSERNRSEPFPEGYGKATSQPSNHRSLVPSVSAPVISPLITSSSGELTTQDNAMKQEDRKAIVREIIDSERRYVATLEQISQTIQKLRQSSVLDEELMNGMFHNLRLGELAVHHQILLKRLKQMTDEQSGKQTRPKSKTELNACTIATVMYSTFQSSSLHDNYLAYVRYCESSKDLIKQQLTKNASFTKLNARFELENKSGYDLNHAVSLPANRLLSYKMLLERYQKCTPPDDPDYDQVPKAIDNVNYLLDYVGKVDPTIKKTTLKALEGILDVAELVSPDREFLRVDTVKIEDQRGEFRIWMFSDLVLLTINKMHRRTDSRKESESLVVHGQHGQDIVPRNKKSYKLHKRAGLDDTEVLSSPETEVKKYTEDIKTIQSDLVILRDIQAKATHLSRAHGPLSTQVTNVIHRCEHNLYSLRQSTEKTNLASLRLLLQTPDGAHEYTVIFKDAKIRSVWEEDLMTAKRNLEAAIVNKKPPEFVDRIPVKTRAGMQFTCAASSLTFTPEKEVWFCNSDSTIGHLCRMSVSSQPSLIDSIPVPGCSGRIACMCATPPHTDTALDVYDSPQTPNTTLDLRHSLMWLGCDDGVIYIISASKGRQPFRDRYVTLKCEHAVLSIVHMDGRVFVALNKRKIQIYRRNHDGIWDTDAPHTVTLSTQGAICQLLPVSYKLWCASGNEITVLNTEQPERTFKVCGDKDKNMSIQAMAYSRQGIVAVALRSSCDIKLFHHSTYKHLGDINVFSAVAQKLSKCDEIITQHKTACLKITSLTCCKHILWVGTTAGVLLTLRLPKMLSTNASQLQLDVASLSITALDIGHTGNVRFLTFTELVPDSKEERRHSVARHSLVNKMLVISGGDGYEVIDPSKELKESIGTIGHNDSINHLLVWKI